MINININQSITLEQKIAAIIDSKNLINNILSTYYGTEREKEDIKRNVEHLNQCLLDNDLLPNLSTELLSSINDVILRSQGVLQ